MDGEDWYEYCRSNPLRYVDPDRMYVETLLDAAFLGYDVKCIIDDPKDWTNYAAFGLDIVCTLLPVATGGGALIHGGKATTQLAAHTSVWALGPAKRGQLIEKMLGGMGNNFPVIDKFINGANNIALSVTSIKSIDLAGSTYQPVNAVYRKIMSDARKLASFSTTTYGGIKVAVNSKTQRILEVAIPKKGSLRQLEQIKRAIKDAADIGVQVIVRVFE